MIKPDLAELSKALTDQGKLIEAGWIGMRLAVISPQAPDTQIREMRLAFFSGAQHLFSSIMSILEPGAEPTDKDMDRLTLINNELHDFGRELELRLTQAQGSA